MITKTGGGLKIIISCDYVKHHHWMSYLSWFSFVKNLPDAEVSIMCKRGMDKYELFSWCYKFKVPIIFYNDLVDSKDFIIPPSVMAVREVFDNNLSIIPAKSEDFATFVDYVDGVGNILIEKYINKIRFPLLRNMISFHTGSMTFNEIKIFELWEQAFVFYGRVQNRGSV